MPRPVIGVCNMHRINSTTIKVRQILRQVTRLTPHVLATNPLGDDRQDSRYLLLRTITYLLNAGGAAR